MRKFSFAILIFLAPAISMAQGYNSGRAQTWDFTIGGLYQQADVASGDGGSSLEVDDTWGFGFNIGYNYGWRF